MKISKAAKIPHFQNLDALRFLAFFAVFVHHSVISLGHKTTNPLINLLKTKYMVNGALGVNFFFVLSGFLITYLLLVEKNNTNKIDIRRFYLKRILRIWPLYFLVLSIGFTIIPALAAHAPVGFYIFGNTKEMSKNLYLLFLGNFDYVKNGINNTVVGILWSVSVEEQFYLVWPILIAITPQKHLVKLFTGIIIFSTVYRLVGMSGKTLNLMQSYHTFSLMSDLTIGGLFAIAVSNDKILERIKTVKLRLIILIYVIGISLILFRTDILSLEMTQNQYIKLLNFTSHQVARPRPMQYIHAIMPLIYSIFFGFIIVEQVFANRSLFKIGKINFFTQLGKISYGLYCFHMIVMFIVVYSFFKLQYPITTPDKILVMAESSISFILTILISYFSYRYFEKRFLVLKEKLGARIALKTA